MGTKYTHTNIIAKDWRRLAAFYRDVFGCRILQPERDLSGEWLDKGTGVADAHITGAHLLLPGHGEHGPTLEIFSYDAMPEHPDARANTPGFSHIAFAVDDLEATAREMLARGCRAIGELMAVPGPGGGELLYRYVADPEGNIVELQGRRGV